MLLLNALVLIILFHSNVNNQIEIPNNFWKELYKIKSSAELRQKFNVVGGQNTNRFPGDTQAGSLATASDDDDHLPQDGCSPRNLTVSLPQSPPGLFYLPSCVQLPQCGGCCSADMYACLPLSSATVDVKTTVYRLTSSHDLEVVGVRSFPVEVHKECDCACRVRQKDCNALQVYAEEVCRCLCRNSADALTCVSPTKWSDSDCTCVCPNIVNCKPDEVFSFQTCSCQKLSVFSGGQQMPTGSSTTNACAGRVCRPGFQAVLVGKTCNCVPK